MKALVLFVCVLGAASVFAQNPETPAATPAPPSYANYSLMLVNPASNGGAVVLMHNPKNELEMIPVNSTKQAMDAGYIAVRAVELGELITALKDENARLVAENTQLRIDASKQVAVAAPTTSPADAESQRRAQIEAEKAANRRQLIQNWMTLQNMNRPPQTQNLNVRVTDCTRLPALCIGR